MKAKGLCLLVGGMILVSSAFFLSMGHCRRGRQTDENACAQPQETASIDWDAAFRVRASDPVICDEAGRPLPFLVLPKWRVPSSEEACAARTFFQGLADAYLGGDLDAFRKESRQMPNCVTNLPPELLGQLERPLSRLMYERFLLADDSLDSASEADLAAYLELNLSTVRFLGELLLKRGDGLSDQLPYFERRTLIRLNRLAQNMERTARVGAHACVVRFRDQWISQIDSPTGFTRQYVLSQIDLQWPHISGAGWTAERRYSVIKEGIVAPLMREGHTPAWLDELRDVQRPRYQVREMVLVRPSE